MMKSSFCFLEGRKVCKTVQPDVNSNAVAGPSAEKTCQSLVLSELAMVHVL